MSGSTHDYVMTLLAGGDEVILRRSRHGTRSITLDAGRAPHVSGTLTIARPPEDVADLLDVRSSPPPRVRVTADAVFGDSTQHREFDLTVRSRPVRHRDGTMTLTLASDDALIEDYAPLEDIRLLAVTDLATLCEAVILESTGESVSVGGETADITPLWDARNELLNPSLGADAANWGAGSGASALTRVAISGGGFGLRWQSAAGDSDVYPHSGITQTRATPGKVHIAGVRVQSTIARMTRLTMRFYDVASGLLAEFSSPYALSSTGGHQEYVVEGLAPSQSAYVFVFIHTTGNTAGQFHFASRARLVTSEFDPGHFDGATADTALYDYAWTGPANASPSTRRALIDAPEPAALVWDAGQSGLDFLHPLVQAAGLRLVCDEARSWTLRDEDYSASGALNLRAGVNIIDAEDVIDRADDQWYDAAVTIYIWPDVYGVEQRRIDAYGMPGYSRLRRFEKRTPYPGPGFSEYAVRRAQSRGRTVTFTTVADWRAQAEQPLVVRLTGAPIQTGKTDRVTFNLDRDEMTGMTRSTDTPEGAIDLLPGVIDALVGVIHDL